MCYVISIAFVYILLHILTEFIEVAEFIIANGFDFELVEIEQLDFPCGEDVDRIDLTTRWVASDGSARR